MIARIGFPLETVALGLWVGALAGFAFIFAPIAFHTVTDLDQFNTLIGGVAARLTAFGVACGLVALAGLLLQILALRSSASLARAILVAIMLGLSLYAQQAIVPQMQALVGSFHAPFAQIARSDPRRVAYDRLHEVTRRTYGAVLVAGVFALGWGAAASRKPRGTPAG